MEDKPSKSPIPAEKILNTPNAADPDLAAKFNIVGHTPPSTFHTQPKDRPDAPIGNIIGTPQEVADYHTAVNTPPSKPTSK